MGRAVIFIIFFLLVSVGAGAQKYDGFRLTAQVGASVPFGDYAASASEGDYLNRDAERGFDFNLSGEVFLTKRLGLIIRLGYALHEIDEHGISLYVTGDGSADVRVTTSPFQNLYAAGGLGLQVVKFTDRISLQPYALAGVNILRTAVKDYDFTDDFTGETRRFAGEAKVDPGIVIIPGMNLNMRIAPFFELRFYAEVFGSDHQTKTKTETYDGTLEIREEEIDYRIRTVNAGAALSFRF